MMWERVFLGGSCWGGEIFEGIGGGDVLLVGRRFLGVLVKGNKLNYMVKN